MEIEVFDRATVLARKLEEAEFEVRRLTRENELISRARDALDAAGQELARQHRRALVTLDLVERTLGMFGARYARTPHHPDDCPENGKCNDCLLNELVDTAHRAARQIVQEGGPQ